VEPSNDLHHQEESLIGGLISAVAKVTIEQLANVELTYPTLTAGGDLASVTTRPGHGTQEQTRAVEWEHRAG
jgi:hypothetical protein